MLRFMLQACLAPGTVILCTHDTGVPYIFYIPVYICYTHNGPYEKHIPIEAEPKDYFSLLALISDNSSQ